MSSVKIHDGRIVYEILGPADGHPIVLTPGGRFDITVPGLRPLAHRLVAGGMRVLLWDRPNCGASDVQFWGQSESHMRAQVLADLLRALGMAPAVVAGGSGGARDSIITAMEHPDVAAGLVTWHISGGVYSQMRLASVYVLPSLGALAAGGMEAVLQLPHWRDCVTANPGNRGRLLRLGADRFRDIMLRWLDAYVPKDGQTIPGVPDEDFGKVKVPTLIVRGGEKDLDHPRTTSIEVHRLIRGSELVDPPWPEDAFERAVEAMHRGEGHVFDSWPWLAPLILKFSCQ